MLRIGSQRGADDAGVGSEFRLGHWDVGVKFGPEMFVKSFAERLVEQAGGATEAAADHDAFRIERVDQLRNMGAERKGAAADNFSGEGLSHAGERDDFASIAKFAGAAGQSG